MTKYNFTCFFVYLGHIIEMAGRSSFILMVNRCVNLTDQISIDEKSQAPDSYPLSQ